MKSSAQKTLNKTNKSDSKSAPQYSKTKHHQTLAIPTQQKITFRPFILSFLAGLILGILSSSLYFFFFNSVTHPIDSTQLALLTDYAATSQKSALYNQKIEYTSSLWGYRLSFDPNVWSEGFLTDLSRPDLKDWSLSLRSTYGYAQILFTVEDDFKSSVEWEQQIGGYTLDPNLDQLDNYIAWLKFKHGDNLFSPPSEGDVLTDLKKTEFLGHPAYQAVYQRDISGYKVTHEEFYFLVDDLQYTVVIHAPKLGSASAYVDAALSSIQVFGQNDPVESEVLGIFDSGKQPSDPLTEAKLVELVEPSVVSVLHLYCKDVKVTPPSQSINLMRPSYNFCNGGKGSGFIVSQEGLIATNGHVAHTYPEEAFLTSVHHPAVRQFWLDLVKQTVYFDKGVAISDTDAAAVLSLVAQKPSGMDVLYQMFYKLLEAKIITLSDSKDLYYVKLGKNPIDLKLDSAKLLTGDLEGMVGETQGVLAADLLNYDYGNRLASQVVLSGQPVTGSDVALLKVNSPDWVFPSLKISQSKDLKQGDSIIVMGFPGLVEGSKTQNAGLLDYDNSSIEATVTKGIVSAIKTDTGGLLIIQTDASIDHGSSGGPAFNLNGEIVGIATYGIESSNGNFNFLRDTADLIGLMEENSSPVNQLSQTSQEWHSGLNDFWLAHYTKSLKKFNSVASLYPVHPKVDTITLQAKSAIENGQDRGLLFGLDRQLVLGLGLAFITIIIAAILFYLFKLTRKTPSPAPDLPQPQTQQPSQPLPSAPLPAQSPSPTPTQQTTPSVIAPQAPPSITPPDNSTAQPQLVQAHTPTSSTIPTTDN